MVSICAALPLRQAAQHHILHDDPATIGHTLKLIGLVEAAAVARLAIRDNCRPQAKRTRWCEATVHLHVPVEDFRHTSL